MIGKLLLVFLMLGLFLVGFVSVDYTQRDDGKIVITIPQKATMTTPSGEVITGEMINGKLIVTKPFIEDNGNN